MSAGARSVFTCIDTLMHCRRPAGTAVSTAPSSGVFSHPGQRAACAGYVLWRSGLIVNIMLAMSYTAISLAKTRVSSSSLIALSISLPVAGLYDRGPANPPNRHIVQRAS